MTSLIVRGGQDLSGAPVTVSIADGLIVGTTPDAPVLDATGLTVAPGLIDLQVNGAAGVDVTAEPARLWEVAGALPRFGVTAFLPTVITSSPEAREQAMAMLAGGPPDGWTGAVPLGLHFEGPMLSPRRRGAHPSGRLAEPSLELVAGWSPEAGVRLATIAPELPGALEVIRVLAARGVIVAIGHTEADAAVVRQAIAAGARMLTHLGNAMEPLLARRPGPIGVALGTDELAAGVIADGHHLDALTVNVVWRALGPARFVSVTDTTAALGVPDGRRRLGEQEIIVEQGTVRLQDGTIAGSAASLPQCLRFLRDATRCTLAEAVATATTNPAGLLGDRTRGSLRPGARGDLTLFDGGLGMVATIVGGRLVHGELR